MPSAAMIAGRATIRSILPQDMVGPETNIRARGNDIAISIYPHRCGGTGGEYRETVLLPTTEGRDRDERLERLRAVLLRWAEVETVRRMIREEDAACDADDDGNLIDDDMPVPEWRTHCPAVLRRIADVRGTDGMLDEARSGMDLGRAILSIDHVDDRTAHLHHGRGSRCRTIVRITLQAPGVVYSQGISRSYVKIARRLPDTTTAALIGRPAAELVDLPGLDVPGLRIRNATASRDGVVFDVDRAFAMLAPPPARQGTDR